MSRIDVQGDDECPWNASLSGLCPKTPQPLPHPCLLCLPLLPLLLLALPFSSSLSSLFPISCLPFLLLLLAFPSSCCLPSFLLPVLVFPSSSSRARQCSSVLAGDGCVSLEGVSAGARSTRRGVSGDGHQRGVIRSRARNAAGKHWPRNNRGASPRLICDMCSGC